MTRDEYLLQLEGALDFLDADTRAAALSFYAEMLEDRIEEYHDEAAAVAAMDSPEAIAQRLMHENKEEKQESPDAEKIFSAVADYARQAAANALEATEEILQGANTIAHAAAGRAEGAYQAIRDEIKKGEDGDYDRHDFSCPADGVRAVSLIAQDMPIHIFIGPDDQIHLTYYSHPEDPYAVEATDREIRLYPKAPRKNHGIFRRPARHWWQRLRCGPMIELSLPENMACALSANTCNASIQLSGLQGLNEVSLHSSNARITIEDIRCRSLEIYTSNSRISLYRTESQSFIRGKTNNSRVIGENLSAGADLSLQSSNGGMDISRCTAKEGCTIVTSNGSIDVNRLQGSAIRLRTSNGAIRGALPGPITAWRIDSGTSNGRNSLPYSLPGEKPLSVHTSNGHIDVIFIDE